MSVSDTTQPAQPRYAAFLSSIGRAQTVEEANAYGRAHSHCDFMDFIGRARSSADEAIVHRDGRILDQDGFTAHCWTVANAECQRNFPS